ncbi:hypothetical protein HNP46_006061 [Pseudomonas nitritireducens]|uniref:Uncharacterized protein n=1 Tax=Pseudomonas nitroreducens TaxID=46680 RepID=A0A7W7KRB7_PSENT|nr:hypothetical protein [Pseudomonas nitritireducens]MBB4867150.1 hypothetical protein [Pseudomonas nitritireducens]
MPKKPTDTTGGNRPPENPPSSHGDLFAGTSPARKGKLSDELSREINSHRARLAPFFNGNAKPNPSVSFANDGTGFGKSYNVFDQFIEHASERNDQGGHRNLFFMTPMKSQIDISPATKAKAEARGIHFLSFLSIADIADLEFTGWVTGIKNEKLYRGWIQKLTTIHYQDATNELSSSISNLTLTLADVEDQKRRGDLDLARKQELEQKLKQARRRLNMALVALAKAVITEPKHGAYITTAARFAETDPKGAPYIEILDHILPFERAKVGPTIILATTAKFMAQTHAVYVDQNQKPNLKLTRFDSIVGAKRDTTAAEKAEIPSIGSVCNLTFDEKITYLKESFFLRDDKNYFLEHGITFTLVVDEEHDSYDWMHRHAHKKLISDQVKPSHVLAGLYRLMEAISPYNNPGRELPLAHEETAQLINDLRRHYNEDCDASVSLESILKMCAGNVGHITIDNRDVEQILALSKNIFSLTPRRFYNEDALKRIRMRSMFGGSELRLSFDDGRECSDPSLHDFLQALLCAFYACSKIAKPNSALQNLLNLGQAGSQNSPLSRFISTSRLHRPYVASLFERAKDAEVLIDEFFAFFVPKIVFSLEKVREIPFGDDVAANRVFVDFHLDLILELPEVTLLRAMHGTQNSAMCLSATTGFKKSFSGNFSRPMLKNFGEAQGNSLQVQVVERSEVDQQAMSDLRAARAQARTIDIRPYHNTAGNEISDLRQDKAFKAELKIWTDRLIPPGFPERNKYRLAALRRQVEAMLMAAWDGKNSLILSLNNNFTQRFKELFEQNVNGRLKGYRQLHEDKIFELKPFADKCKIRVILFSSELARDVDVDQYLKVDDDTRICLVSAYGSAGTGLNLFVEHREDKFTEDFDRLVLVNTPFYSAIKEGDSGLNTVKNHILLLKHLAVGTGVRLSEFDANPMKPRNNRILMDEHDLSVLKIIIQAVGRVERRDSHLLTEIFLPDDVIDDLVVKYSRLRREGNDILINSLSLLNHRLMQFCLEKAEARCFSTEEERSSFTAMVLSDAIDIDDFFTGAFRRKILVSAREGNREAMAFNELLRSSESITDPAMYVRKLMNSPIVKESGYYQRVIKTFYMPKEITDRVSVCTTRDNHYELSDLLHGYNLYQPDKMIVPEYIRRDGVDRDFGPRIITLASNLGAGGIDSHLPNPAMIPLLKGNVGEYIFGQLLKELGIMALTLDEMISLLGPAVCELYDCYILQDDVLICIDVKRWSLSLNNEEQSLKTLDRAKQKRQNLYELCGALNLTPRFLYVNTQHGSNALNSEREFDSGESIHFLNAFKKLTEYVPAKKSRIFRVDEHLMINPTLVSLLRSAE